MGKSVIFYMRHVDCTFIFGAITPNNRYKFAASKYCYRYEPIDDIFH